MPLPTQVTLVEVSPRDGLQNEAQKLSTATKLSLINQLALSGMSIIETTSFVSPQWVPQMADHQALVQGLQRYPGVKYPVLVPNLRGLQTALADGVTEIAVFTAASNTFSQKNTNSSIAASIERIQAITQIARAANLYIRGYISCVIACPYEGPTPPQQVLTLAKQLLDCGCEHVSLGDTIGVGSPGTVMRLLDYLLKEIPPTKLAVHFHDTYGQALANIMASLPYGIQIIDCSVAGLGGCPYAPGASGNVASEDVVYLLEGLGIETGVNLNQLIAAGQFICEQLGITTRSKVAQAKQRSLQSSNSAV